MESHQAGHICAQESLATRGHMSMKQVVQVRGHFLCGNVIPWSPGCTSGVIESVQTCWQWIMDSHVVIYQAFVDIMPEHKVPQRDCLSQWFSSSVGWVFCTGLCKSRGVAADGATDCNLWTNSGHAHVFLHHLSFTVQQQSWVQQKLYGSQSPFSLLTPVHSTVQLACKQWPSGQIHKVAGWGLSHRWPRLSTMICFQGVQVEDTNAVALPM